MHTTFSVTLLIRAGRHRKLDSKRMKTNAKAVYVVLRRGAIHQASAFVTGTMVHDVLFSSDPMSPNRSSGFEWRARGASRYGGAAAATNHPANCPKTYRALTALFDLRDRGNSFHPSPPPVFFYPLLPAMR